MVPLLIELVNWASKLALQQMSLFEKRHTVSDQNYSATINIAAISFLNVGVIVLLVNLKINAYIPVVPILQGNYNEFSVEWYRLVGASLCVQLGLMVISDALTSCVWALKNFCTRCYDRKCTCDPKKTRKLTQHDYEEANFGPEIEMQEKYATMLVVALLAFSYGPGLPIMYLLAALYFFVSYWTDKIMIFYNHRKPLYFDEQLAL